MFRSAAGSSPLARGLQEPQNEHHPQGRIIPARAGFTARRHDGASENGDHPRSRGVYQGQISADVNTGRIIPARAGFTRIELTAVAM